MLENIIFGVIIGAKIAFVAIGFSLTFSILKFLNFAHGQMIALGAYLCYVCYELLSIQPFILSVSIAILTTGFIAILIERIIYKPIRDQGRLILLISSLGVSIALQATISLIFGSSPLVLSVSDPIMTIGPITFFYRELIMVVFLISSFFIATFLLKRSRYGIAIRSIAVNHTRAKLLGIPVDRVISIIFFISASLAALAGIVIAVGFGITPLMGFDYMIWAFAVAVISGLGSIRGILITGLVFGVIINLSIVYGSSLFANAISLFCMSLVLVVRPNGLFTIKNRIY